MKNISLSKVMTIFVVTAIIICSAAVGIFAYVLERNEVISSHGMIAQGVANTVVSALDVEQFKDMLKTHETNDYYNQFSAFLDKTLVANDLMYLYLLDVEYSSKVTYFAEGYKASGRDGAAELMLGDTEGAEYYDALMFETMKTGKPTVTDISDSGDFGMVISAFTAIKDSSGKVVGVVGVDLPIADVIKVSNNFGLTMIAIVAGMSLISVLFIVLLVRKYLTKPISHIIYAAEELAIGNIEIEGLDDGAHPTGNEIIKLERAFSNMLASFRQQAYILARLAEGDYTSNVEVRSDKDVINLAIKLVLEETLGVLHSVASAGIQVTETSRHIAAGAQELAQGAALQSDTVQHLSSSMGEISTQTKENAEMALKAATLATSIKQNAEKGSKQMSDMMEAVKKIHESSQSISKVIKVIDDIAFQTNILALNAAVEAARAGAAGKGFAVVAEEVRNLAAKSAEAAKDTNSLISSSIEKSDLGSRIANETSKSLEEIVRGIIESNQIVSEIAHSSEKQFKGIESINKGVEEVAYVVKQNSETAEKSAVAAGEMNAQSVILDDLIQQFQLRKKLLGQ